jgi:ketosteroid isomerase-like protein
MTKLRARLLILLAVGGIAFAPTAYSQSDGDKAAVMALNQRLLAAFNHHDAAAIMDCYSNDPDAIFFEDTIPFQFNKAALAKVTEDFFKSPTDFQAKMNSYDSVVSGNLAAVHYIIRSSWADKNGKHLQTSRYTQIDRKDGGKWLVWHEHFSLPFDPATGKAVFNASP